MTPRRVAGPVGRARSTPTHEVPWLWFLFYARSGGSLEELITTTGGAQELRIGAVRSGLTAAAEVAAAL